MNNVNIKMLEPVKTKSKKKYPKFQPNLSGKCPKDLSVKYPVIVSEKLDGIRCLIKGGVAYSRKMLPIPNKFVQAMLKGLPDGIDGELIIGDIHHPDVRNKSQSVMAVEGEPDFIFYVFDWFKWQNVIPIQTYHGTKDLIVEPLDLPFTDRYSSLFLCDALANNKYCKIVPHHQIKNAVDLKGCSDYYLSLGAEGIMVRDPNGVYKFGRSTEIEGGLLKHKPFVDAEAEIVGFKEFQHNDNEADEDAFGRIKRSSHKENLIAGNKLGAFKCKMVNKNGKEVYFDLGTGKFTDAMRIEFWQNRQSLVGKIVNFKYQNLSANGIPCVMSFQGFRLD